jgi:hypothetical protein
MLGNKTVRKIFGLKPYKVTRQKRKVIIRASTFIFYTNIYFFGGKAAGAWP